MRRRIVYIVAGVVALCFIGFVIVALLSPDEEEPVITELNQNEAAEVEDEPAEPTEPPVESEPTTPPDEPAPEPEPTATPEPTSTPTPEPPQEANLGDLFELDGYSLVALTVEDPAPPGLIYSPTEGTKLVAVEIVVGNVSGERITVNVLNATLLDVDGFTYVPELAGRDNQLILVDLEPGERVKGWAAFEVPEGTVPASVKYEASGFPEIVLQSNLTTADGEMVANPDVPLTASGDVEREPAVALGETAENDGYSLVVETLEDPAPHGLIYNPTEGTKLVAVEIVVGNESGEQITVNALNTILIDTNGYLYEAELAGRDGQIELVDLNAGERVRGWVAFEIPENATPESVRYQVTGFPIVELRANVSE